MEIFTADVLRVELNTIRETVDVLSKSVRLVQSQITELSVKIREFKKQEREWQKTDNFKQWTDDDQIAAVKRFFVEFNRSPITSDFNAVEWLPSTTSVRGHWGSIAALREAAGLDAGLKGRGGAGRGGGWTDEKRKNPFKGGK